MAGFSADRSTFITELKDGDADLVELQACHTKRALYRSFLTEHGYKLQVDHKSRPLSCTKDGEECPVLVSWASFLAYWKVNFPKVVIQSASEDICDDCVIFANSHRYLKRRRRGIADGEESDDEEDTTPMALQDPAEDVKLRDAEEDVILAAGHHVKMAREQRELFNTKKIEAREHASSLRPQGQRTYTFVGDFAQNMYLPNFSAEQPGLTYYFSPLNMYPFGIVDASTEPTLLTTYIYSEGTNMIACCASVAFLLIRPLTSTLVSFLLLLGDAKKNGNAVASMLWKLFHKKGLLNGKTANEINLVFDNCGGQNKNRMVYRMLFFLVKLHICRVARVIFLIKGHTKNDCDRMFNLMKYDYRKVDCFTPSELIALANKHPQVEAIGMELHEFKDWDALEDTMIKLLPGVKKNHIFCVKAKDSNAIMVQEHASGPITRHVLVREEYQERDWRPLFALQQVVPPGLPDIKWNELYAKWGKYVPENRKHGLKYYTSPPPATIKAAIAKQSADAKRARSQRTRGETVAVSKKRGRPKKDKN